MNKVKVLFVSSEVYPFAKVGGLADAESLVAGDEVAGETLTLAVLEKHHDDEEHCRDQDENGQDCK